MAYADDIDGFINGVLDGTVTTGRLAELAVRRHVMDLEHAGSRGLWFDEEAAAGAIEFFPLCRHTTGEFAGQPFELRQFQKFVVGCLFGWKRRDGSRRYRDAMVSFARGNGKSPLGAGIGLQLFCFDQPPEPRAEVYCTATKRDQAKIVFEEAKRLAESGQLKRIGVEIQTNRMCLLNSHSRMEPLGSDSNNTDGLVIHGLIRDELHAWQEKHRGLYDKLETAMGKRRQPLALTITTAGDDTSELWKEAYEFSRRVVEQVIDPPEDPSDWFGDDHFSFICEVDKDDDIYDERNWVKANPMLLEPHSPVKVEHLRSMADKARAGDILSELRFRRYHCNQMVASLEKAFTPETWSLGNEELTVTDGALAFGGIDLARSDDFCAITLVFPFETEENTTFEVKTWAFTTEERSKELRTEEFRRLLSHENMIVHEGNQIDFNAVRAKCVALSKQYNVKRWAYDSSWARETGQFLEQSCGFHVEEFPQTAYRYNEPISQFIKALTQGRVRHGGCEVLKWCAGNVILRKNAQDLCMPDKQNSSNKIDPIVALFMGFAMAIFAEEENVEYWDPSQGILL